MTIRNFKFVCGIALVGLLFSSCGKDPDGYSTTESGLKYKFITSNKGVKPSIGDVLIMDIAYYTDKDSLLYDSRLIADSFTVKLVEPTFIGGVEEGFALMSPGDSALFKASADSLFEVTFFSTLPDYITKGSDVHFRVKLKSIVPAAYADSVALAKDISSRRIEFDKLEYYLLENNINVMPTKNGAYLSVSKQGTGPFPKSGDSVFVAYTGTLMDGTVFDKSVDKNPPFGFVLGNKTVIEGWEECMPLLNKGSVAKMVIPSDLAYGAEDFGRLPGYSTLIFDVEILEIKPGN